MMMILFYLYVWHPVEWISLQTMQYKSHIQKSRNKNTTILQRQQLIRGLDIMVQGVWYKRMSEFNSYSCSNSSDWILL